MRVRRVSVREFFGQEELVEGEVLQEDEESIIIKTDQGVVREIPKTRCGPIKEIVTRSLFSHDR